MDKESREEFLLLCNSLKINPPVVKENLGDALKEEVVLENVSDKKNDNDNSCDKIEEKENSEPQLSDKDMEDDYLENLQSPKGESDEETPDNISDFLNQLNETALKTNNNDDKPGDGCEDDHSLNFEALHEIEDTFKMPESFDIPQDYIKEIYPNKTKVVTMRDPKPPEPETSKTEIKSKAVIFDETLKDEDNNTTVGDEVVEITYKKDATSKRNQGIKGKINPKRDRKKMMADLFNDSDSDQTEEDGEKSAGPSSSISLSDLEEKRIRVKDKLSGERAKPSPKKSFLSQTRKLLTSTSQSHSRNEEDEKFVVADHESSVSESEEEPDPNLSSESESDDRRKRLEDRKKKKGGDVLAWMNKSAKVKVTVQTNPKAFIQDLAQYR